MFWDVINLNIFSINYWYGFLVAEICWGNAIGSFMLYSGYLD